MPMCPMPLKTSSFATFPVPTIWLVDFRYHPNNYSLLGTNLEPMNYRLISLGVVHQFWNFNKKQHTFNSQIDSIKFEIYYFLLLQISLQICTYTQLRAATSLCTTPWLCKWPNASANWYDIMTIWMVVSVREDGSRRRNNFKFLV